jgi:hypothetical protein
VHAWASSWPVAPPNEIFTSPPCLRIASIWSLNAALRGSNALNQAALHPTAVTNATVNDRTPPPAHGAPLTVHPVGARVPATMNPKLVDDPAGTVAL